MSDWTLESREIEPRTRLVTLHAAGARVGYGQALRAIAEDAAMRTALLAQLRTERACFWELPPVTVATLEQPFEYVTMDAPGLERSYPNSSAFAQQLEGATADVVTFPNLGRDAILVVPKPIAEEHHYGHLAAFVRGAPEPQQHALLQAVAAAMSTRISEKPTWLSTSGLGVPWLHVRLDNWPKYYGHAPYRDVAG